MNCLNFVMLTVPTYLCQKGDSDVAALHRSGTCRGVSETLLRGSGALYFLIDKHNSDHF